MIQRGKKERPEIVLPGKAAYNLAALMVLFHAIILFFDILIDGPSGESAFYCLLDTVLAILLFFKYDNARILVLIRVFFGIFGGIIGAFTEFDGIETLAQLIFVIIYCVGLMYILAGETKKRHIVVGTICVILLFFCCSFAGIYVLAEKYNWLDLTQAVHQSGVCERLA